MPRPEEGGREGVSVDLIGKREEERGEGRGRGGAKDGRRTDAHRGDEDLAAATLELVQASGDLTGSSLREDEGNEVRKGNEVKGEQEGGERTQPKG